MSARLAGMTGATLETAPAVCHGCVWWQSRNGREADKRRWIEKAEKEWGVWGQLYYDDDGRAARLDAVRPGASSSRARPSCRRARRRTTRCSSPAPTSSTARGRG